MHVLITLVVSLCSGTNMSAVATKKAELEKQFPGSKVSVRIDKKCVKDGEK
jgi:hypothetical protein